MTELIDKLESIINNVYYDYRPTGDKKPKTRWLRDENGDCIYVCGERQCEPVLDENGNQIYEDVWDNIQKSDDELTDDDKALIQACYDMIDFIGKEGTK